jgi:hypothetical protein
MIPTIKLLSLRVVRVFRGRSAPSAFSLQTLAFPQRLRSLRLLPRQSALFSGFQHSCTFYERRRMPCTLTLRIANREGELPREPLFAKAPISASRELCGSVVRPKNCSKRLLTCSDLHRFAVKIFFPNGCNSAFRDNPRRG